MSVNHLELDSAKKVVETAVADVETAVETAVEAAAEVAAVVEKTAPGLFAKLWLLLSRLSCKTVQVQTQSGKEVQPESVLEPVVQPATV